MELEKSTHTHPPRQKKMQLYEHEKLSINKRTSSDWIASHDRRKVLMLSRKFSIFWTIDFCLHSLAVCVYHCHSHERLCFPTTESLLFRACKLLFNGFLIITRLRRRVLHKPTLMWVEKIFQNFYYKNIFNILAIRIATQTRSPSCGSIEILFMSVKNP